MLSKFDNKQTNWTPKPGKFHALDFYIDKCRRDINKIKFNNPPKRFNNSLEERRALIHLRQREDIFIKAADKGGAVAVWHKQLYMDEAYRQLTDNQHYTQENEDMTTIHNNFIQQEINRLIVNGDLPKSVVHLIVPNPRTARFYILPKIHKANIPGRPIVSACNCPTEIISSFLDDIMQPIVHSLPSYIKDTTDALQTFQNYRFSSSSNKLVFSMDVFDVKSLYTSIPRICSDDTDFHEKAKEQTQFFLNQGYPEDITETAFSKVKNQPRHSVLQYQDSSTDVNKQIPLVLTYHPTNIQVKNVIFENYPIISTNHETRDIFDQLPLLSWKKTTTCSIY